MERGIMERGKEKKNRERFERFERFIIFHFHLKEEKREATGILQ